MNIGLLKKPLMILSLLILAGAAIFLIFSATKKNASRRCKGLEINIKNIDKQLLVSKRDVESWVTDAGNDPFEGKIIDKINLSKIEKRALSSGYIKNCQAYIDLQGMLNIDVDLYQPLARILPLNNEPHRYIDIEGNIFPFSNNYSPTVLLISGDYFHDKKSLKSASGKDMLNFLNAIANDKFWNSQITQITIDKQSEISMLPLMGNHIIEFGKPEKINAKLKKLLLFYSDILPRNQWSQFSKVSVKYEGQIVCS
jgi:cell division protein FtsQ